MNNRERGEKIRLQILRDVKHHPNDISRHIRKIFSITPQAVNNHIRRLEKEGWLASGGVGKGKRYFLGDLRKYHSYFHITSDLAEDQIWRGHYSFIFEGLPENIVDICHYGFTEMVNNAIDHSVGEGAYVSIERNSQKIVIYVIDNGEGIFRRITRLCELSDERQAIFELSKGKLTTDPDRHTGEGIFFTSRVFDKFEIDSKGLSFSHDGGLEYDFLNESNISAENAGTLVYMSIQRDSNRNVQEVFDKFTAGPDEFQFNRTIIPVRLAQYENEKLVSRSQAKRMLIRIERFQNVIFDFEGVTAIGQAFADEIFRVYAYMHPETVLVPVKMGDNVSKMIMKATFALEEQLKAPRKA
jgi:anti-sigma regulatory factor (Ser/Thr protein kinase)